MAEKITQFWLVSLLRILVQCQVAYSTILEDSNVDPIDSTEDFLVDSTLRGCECWRWPDCISNCTVNPILQTQMRSDHLLLASLPRPFVLMFPYQDRKSRSKYGTSTAGKRGTYFMSTKFWIQLPNRGHVQLKIQKSSIIGPPNSYSTLYYQQNKNGQAFPFASNKLDHCFYNGTVRRTLNEPDMDSYVAVDTCHGLRGLIVVEKETFGVLPLQCSTCKPGLMPHVAFPQVPSPIDRDVSLSVFWQPTEVMSRMAPRLKKMGDHLYSVRLAVILDHQLFLTFDRKLESCIHYIGAIINQATKSFQDTPIELKLVRSEIWNLNNRISLNTSIKTTLNNLAVYSTRPSRSNHNKPDDYTSSLNADINSTRKSMSRLHRRSSVDSASGSTSPTLESQDIEVLLTTTHFSEPVEYLAVPDSICTPRALAVIQVNQSETVYHISRLLSLAVAEVLGLKSFPCPDYYSCTSDDLLSKGDKGRVRLALLTGMSDCLIASTLQESRAFRTDTCGNGRLDRGEECDLGLGSSSFNRSMPCCNPKTCLADVGAVCTHGACCNGCKFETRGTVCRTARDQCDLPEFCTGTQPNCPTDLYLENGSPCKTQPLAISDGQQQPLVSNVDEANALCYHGRCPTRESQCQSIWGPGARTAADYCFVLHNTRTAGACGVHGENCLLEHAMCGLLHCQGGQPRPVSAEAQTGQPFLTYTEHEGKQFECKHLSHVSSVRFVPEGAACAANQYCFHQQCVSPNVALRSQCPAAPVTRHLDDGRIVVENVTCSNHGLCTNAGFCLCHPGWTDSVCHVPDTTGTLSAKSTFQAASEISRPKFHPDPDLVQRIWVYRESMLRSGVAPDSTYGVAVQNEAQLNTMYLVAILGSVIGGMLIFLAIFVSIYRRRGRSGFSRKTPQSRCCFWTQRDHSSGRSDTKLNGSLRLYNTSSDGRLLQHATLSPSSGRSLHDRSVESEGRERSYLSRWNKHGRQSSPTHKSSRRHGGRRGNSTEHNIPEHHRSNRRRRKHCSRDNTECDERRRGTRRSAKHSDGSIGPDRDRLIELGTANHSDTELACRQQHSVDFENNSIDRSIKFGSMPSYKEDKLKQTKRPSDNGTTSHTDLQEPTMATLVLSKAGLLVTSTGPYPNFPPTDLTTDTSAFGSLHSHGFSPLPTSGVTGSASTRAPPQLFPHSLSSFGNTDITTPYAWATPVSTPPQQSVILASSALIEAGRASAPSACSTPSTYTNSTVKQKDSENIDETQFSILMENSWRQPEKGILKNKNEGGGATNTGGASSRARKSSDRARRRGGRHKRRHRHHHHKRSHSRDLSDKDPEDECRVSRRSLSSECSYCMRDGDAQQATDRCYSLSSAEQQRIRSQTARDMIRDDSPDSNDNRCTSFSGSSQSSSSSSFSALNANLDFLSSSSSTTSTCSTALEVGPDGVRLDRAAEHGSERHQRTNDGKCLPRARRGQHRIRSSSDGDPVQCEREHRHSYAHHKSECRHRHKQYDRHGKGHNHRRHCRHRDSETEAATTSSCGVSGSSGTVGALESFGSSSSTNPNSSVGLSGGSSSSSGMVSGSGRHFHRCHRRVRTRKSTDDDATSGSRCSPVHTVPTILCNAGQQTDELSLLRVAKQDDSTRKASNHTSTREVEESEAEWEEVECSESACEECQAANNQAAGSERCLQIPLNKPTPIPQQYPVSNAPASMITEPSSGHTNPAYIQTFRQDGEANMSNASLACQQQSTASSSLGSSKNSRMGTPSMMFTTQPAMFSNTAHHSPHGSLSAVGNLKIGVTNQAASSSSSSSMAGQHSSFSGINPNASTKPVISEDFAGQHSETEVDAHIHQAAILGRSSGTFHTPTPHTANSLHQPCIQTSLASPVAYAMMPAEYFQRPSPGRPHCDGLPMLANTRGPSRSTPSTGPTYVAGLAPMRPANTNPVVYHASNNRKDAYYQHPYEEVATDEYAETVSGGRIGGQTHHIYHQHGIPPDVLDANGCVYSKGDEDEDEDCLSLDERSSANGIRSPASLLGRYDSTAPHSSTNYPRLRDSSFTNPAQQQPQQWFGAELCNTAADFNTGSTRLPLTTQLPGIELNSDSNAKPCTLSDFDDAGSEFSISAFRRDDIRINEPRIAVGAGAVHYLGKPHANNSSVLSSGSRDLGADVRSNDGTCDESDASSLPEAGCDLVQLAQLDISGRPNLLLRDLASQPPNTHRWVSTSTSEPIRTHIAGVSNMFDAGPTRSFQPYFSAAGTQNPPLGSRSDSQPPEG